MYSGCCCSGETSRGLSRLPHYDVGPIPRWGRAFLCGVSVILVPVWLSRRCSSFAHSQKHILYSQSVPLYKCTDEDPDLVPWC